MYLLRKLRRHDRGYEPRREAIKTKNDAKLAAQEAADRSTTSQSVPTTSPCPPATSPSLPYDIAASRNATIKIYNWLAQHEDDPATEVSRARRMTCQDFVY